MIKIGDFSRICRVPVSALRYYAELGLLPPAQVDPFSGYRYYSLEQLPRLYRILALRDLGLSLEQIGAVLRERLSAEQLRGMLRLRQAELREQIVAEQARLNRVQARLRQIEEEGTMSSYDVVIKTVEPQLVAAIRSIVPTYSACSTLFEELYAYLGQHGAGGLCAVQDHNDEYKEHDPDLEAMVFLAAPVPESGRINVYTLPGATVASTLHHGPYEQLGAAYAALIAWVETNGYVIAAPSRELYLQMGDTPATNLTEIQFPVKR